MREGRRVSLVATVHHQPISQDRGKTLPSLSTVADQPVKKLEISARLITRNWILNVCGWVLPLVVAVVTIPLVIRGLGTERFGVLSIASALLGYFGMFDLGLGRATTKFVAESLTRCELDRLSSVVWTSLWSQVVFGLAGTMFMIGLIPALTHRFLRIAPSLVGETRLSLWILAGSLSIVLAGNAFRGVLEAGQRFDVVNYVKVPTNIAMFLLPALAVPLRLSLPAIILSLVVARILATIAYLGACLKFYPTLRRDLSCDWGRLPSLLVFGGWVTISNVLAPLLTYVDRFFIGSLFSMTAVAYYTAPYEAINRAWVVPGTLAQALFPAFTSLDAGGNQHRLEELVARSLKSLVLLSGPALLLVAIFAREMLRLWLGQVFADQSTRVLQILALGMLINSLSLIPFSLLQGIGRPDLTAKFSLLEFPLYAWACWTLLKHWGLPGAAFAWTLRVLVDSILMFGAAVWLKSISVRSLLQGGLPQSALAVLIFGLLLRTSWIVATSLLMQTLFSALLVSLFAVGAWSLVLDNRDRGLLRATATEIRASFGR